MEFFSHIYESWREMQYEKYEAIFRELESANASVRGKTVVDVGSAQGFLIDFMRGQGIQTKLYVGVDVDKSAIRKLNSQLKILASAEALPFKEEVFDVMFCIDVIHLLKDKLDLSPVKEDGVVVVALPSRHESKLQRFVEDMSAEGMEMLSSFSIEGKERECVVVLRKKH